MCYMYQKLNEIVNTHTDPQFMYLLSYTYKFVIDVKLDFYFTGTYSTIGDQELDSLVKTVQQQHPGVGLRMLKGHLKSMGYRIQRERVRKSLLRTDPTGVLQRWRQSIRRRVYNVNSPQALWHIDGNHKLIR